MAGSPPGQLHGNGSAFAGVATRVVPRIAANANAAPSANRRRHVKRRRPLRSPDMDWLTSTSWSVLFVRLSRIRWSIPSLGCSPMRDVTLSFSGQRRAPVFVKRNYVSSVIGSARVRPSQVLAGLVHYGQNITELTWDLL